VTCDALIDESENIDPIEHALPVCHILGAGFSRACSDRYPLSDGFLAENDGLELESRFGSGPVRIDEFTHGLLERIEKAYGSLDGVNLEEVMTDLYTRGFGLGSAWEWASFSNDSVEAAQRDYRALLHFIQAKLFILGRNSGSSAVAQEFLDLLRSQDSIVSLNYDVLVENHLLRHESKPPHWRVGELVRTIGPPSVSSKHIRQGTLEYLDEHRPGVLVKLHGSADWYCCINPACPHYPYMTAGWLTRNDTGDTCWGRCPICGCGIEAAIVPPTHAKPFDRFPRIRFMWWRAFNALRAARRWTFVGTSLSPADFHLSSLIRSSSNHSSRFHPNANGGQICIVNKDADSAREVGRRVFRLLAPEIQEGVRVGRIKITPFASLGRFLDASKSTDAERENGHDLNEESLSGS